MGNDQSANWYNLKITEYEKWANSLDRSTILEEFVQLEKIKPEPKKRDSLGEINVLKRAALKKAYIEKSKWLTEEQIDEELTEIDRDLKDSKLDEGIKNWFRKTREELWRHKNLYAKTKAAPHSPDPRAQRKNIERALILQAKIHSLEQLRDEALEKADTSTYDHIRLQLDQLRYELSGIVRHRREPPRGENECDETQYAIIDKDQVETAFQLKKKIEYLHREHQKLLQQLEQNQDVDINKDLEEEYRKQLEEARAAFKALEQQKDNESQLLYKPTLRF